MSIFKGAITINCGASECSLSHPKQQETAYKGSEGSIQTQYRIAVESAERFEDRIVTQNRFGFLFLALLFSLYGWFAIQEHYGVLVEEGNTAAAIQEEDKTTSENNITSTALRSFLLGIVLPVGLFMGYWFWIIRTSVNRSILKWHIVLDLETKYPSITGTVFTLEWENVDLYKGRLGHDIWVAIAGAVVIVVLSVTGLLLTESENYYIGIAVSTFVPFLAAVTLIESSLRRKVKKNAIWSKSSKASEAS